MAQHNTGRQSPDNLLMLVIFLHFSHCLVDGSDLKLLVQLFNAGWYSSVNREWYKIREIPSKDFLNLHHITHICRQIILDNMNAIGNHFYSIHVIAEYNLSGSEIMCRQINESMFFKPCVHPPKNTVLVKHFAHLNLYSFLPLGEEGHFWTLSIFLNGMVSG